MSTKLSLNDIGVVVESDAMEWVYYRLIDMAIEYGFTVNDKEYEVAVALLRANALDDLAYAWLQETAGEALHYMNEECTYPNVDMWYDDDGIVLVPDFEHTTDIVGKWHIDDVRELYGVTFTDFTSVLYVYGYFVEDIDDETFRVVAHAKH